MRQLRGGAQPWLVYQLGVLVQPAPGAARCPVSGDGARCVQAWHLFIGPDGELSASRNATRITIGADDTGRVRVIVPDGLALAPGIADRIAMHIVEAAVVARDPSARFGPDDDDKEGQAQ